MEDKITELIYLLRQAKTEAEDVIANLEPGAVGVITAYYACSNINKTIAQLEGLKALLE